MNDNTVISNASGAVHDDISCASCNRDIPFGMRFCLACGTRNIYSQMTEKVNLLCIRCGCSDSLNEEYCIACGNPLPTDGVAKDKEIPAAGTVSGGNLDRTQFAKTRHKTGFNWSAEAENRAAPKPGEHLTMLEGSPSPVANASSKINGPRQNKLSRGDSRQLARAAFIAVGVVLGGLSALQLAGFSGARYIFERCHWPVQGVVIYARPGKAKVVLENIGTRELILAQTKDNGSVVLASAVPGQYRLFLESPGNQRVFTDLTVVPNRPTVVGFPEPIQLLSREQ